uniref:Uncharacterized protein n=1 Tax=viral metagenome TaxID=1070528 RepID=A0A6M3IMJ8_9ZZZZ
MPLEIAVRFVLTGGNCDFYREEILYEPLIHEQRIDVQEHQFGVPYVDTFGDIWKTLVITFLEIWSTTRAKIDQLINAEAEMTCYYAYRYYTTTKSLTCIHYPNGMTHHYRYYLGEPSALREVKLTFLQSS